MHYYNQIKSQLDYLRVATNLFCQLHLTQDYYDLPFVSTFLF